MSFRLLITHDLGCSAGLADQVVVMRQARIVEQGAAAQLLKVSTHAYTQTLLRAMPSPSRHPGPSLSGKGRGPVKEFLSLDPGLRRS